MNAIQRDLGLQKAWFRWYCSSRYDSMKQLIRTLISDAPVSCTSYKSGKCFRVSQTKFLGSSRSLSLRRHAHSRKFRALSAKESSAVLSTGGIIFLVSFVHRQSSVSFVHHQSSHICHASVRCLQSSLRIAGNDGWLRYRIRPRYKEIGVDVKCFRVFSQRSPLTGGHSWTTRSRCCAAVFYYITTRSSWRNCDGTGWRHNRQRWRGNCCRCRYGRSRWVDALQVVRLIWVCS